MDEDDIHEIVDNNIFISDLWTARALHLKPKNEITHILSICSDFKSENDPRHKTISLDDSPYSDLLIRLPEACNFIENAVSAGGKVLVHCVEGISRSPTVVCAYLMKTRGISTEEALDLVSQRRVQVEPNPGFLRQLHVFEKCHYNPTEDNNVYREWKEEHQAETKQFLARMFELLPRACEGRIMSSQELPYDVALLEMLLSMHRISHIVALKPCEISVEEETGPRRLFIAEEVYNELLPRLPEIAAFLALSLEDHSSRILVHSFHATRICVAIGAYLIQSKGVESEEVSKLMEGLGDTTSRDVLNQFGARISSPRNIGVNAECS
ncbi:phosphatases II [Sistotremastrum suecicum HHB10207 ss-3]|uniref:protein-tyrosine-phosphatase n=1 Tax=Sistotremastrum suecicum HHB10207 ss-3 TaxID=1314776 RepID=A0A166IJR2_9AGAM|nr:phosphatases II [Sistotremastrum suecicum HHB10207 ss-3]